MDSRNRFYPVRVFWVYNSFLLVFSFRKRKQKRLIPQRVSGWPSTCNWIVVSVTVVVEAGFGFVMLGDAALGVGVGRATGGSRHGGGIVEIA